MARHACGTRIGGGVTAGGDSFTVGDDDALDSAQVDCDDAAEEGSGELAISDAPDVVLVGAQADSAEEEEKDGGELAIVGSDVGCDAPDTTAQADSADAAAVVAAEAEQEPAAPVLPSPADASGVASAEEGTASQLADDKAGASSAEVHVASEKAGGAGGLTIPLAVVIYGRDYGKRSACMGRYSIVEGSFPPLYQRDNEPVRLLFRDDDHIWHVSRDQSASDGSLRSATPYSTIHDLLQATTDGASPWSYRHLLFAGFSPDPAIRIVAEY